MPDSLSCPQCGGQLPIPFEETVVKCPQCRSAVRLTPAQAVLEISSVELPDASESSTPANAEKLDPVTSAQIRQLLQTGQRLKAIQLYHEQTGADLNQSVDAIESLERGPASAAPPAPTHSGKGGCLRVLLGILLFIVMICGGCGAVVQRTDSYACAIRQVEVDPLLAETLGKPVSIYPVAIAPTFSFGSSLDGATSLRAEVFVPVRGGRAWGLLYLSLYDGAASDLYMRATLFTTRGRQPLGSGYSRCP